MAYHTHRIIERTRLVLERDGWRQYPGDANADKGKRCLLGALGEAYRELGYHSREDFDNALATVGAHLPDEATESQRSYLFEWNDEPGRTEAEVFAALDRALEAT